MNNNIDTLAKARVEKLLSDQGAVKIESTRGNKDVWLFGNTIIRLPKGNSRIDIEVLEDIARDQMRMAVWELDMWIGQNG